MRTTVGLAVVSALFASCLWAEPLAAHDLVPQDVGVVRVSACDHQVRFTIALAAGGHGHVTGGNQAAASNYRVSVYSTARKKILMTFDVSEHKMGDTLQFFVPSSRLICDNAIEIRVDDQSQVTESNEKNNRVQKRWKPPGTSGMDNPCMVGQFASANHANREHKCP